MAHLHAESEWRAVNSAFSALGLDMAMPTTRKRFFRTEPWILKMALEVTYELVTASKT